MPAPRSVLRSRSPSGLSSCLPVRLRTRANGLMKGRSKKVDYHYVRTLYTDISVISPFLYFSFIQLINFKSNYSSSAAEFIIRRVYKVRRITFKKQLTTVEGAIPFRVLPCAHRLPFNDGRRDATLRTGETESTCNHRLQYNVCQEVGQPINRFNQSNVRNLNSLILQVTTVPISPSRAITGKHRTHLTSCPSWRLPRIL